MLAWPVQFLTSYILSNILFWGTVTVGVLYYKKIANAAFHGFDCNMDLDANGLKVWKVYYFPFFSFLRDRSFVVEAVSYFWIFDTWISLRTKLIHKEYSKNFFFPVRCSEAVAFSVSWFCFVLRIFPPCHTFWNSCPLKYFLLIFNPFLM